MNYLTMQKPLSHYCNGLNIFSHVFFLYRLIYFIQIEIINWYSQLNISEKNKNWDILFSIIKYYRIVSDHIIKDSKIIYYIFIFIENNMLL